MSIKPRWQNTIKERVKSILALIFIVMIIMGIGYVAGKRLETMATKSTLIEIQKSIEEMNRQLQVVGGKIKKIDERVKSIEKQFPLKRQTIAQTYCTKYFPASQVRNCVRVALQESGGNPNRWSIKINRHQDGHLSRDCGLMQININGTTCPNWILNPDTNMQIALRKWKASGWCAWFCPYGRYLCALQRN